MRDPKKPAIDRKPLQTDVPEDHAAAKAKRDRRDPDLEAHPGRGPRPTG